MTQRIINSKSLIAFVLAAATDMTLYFRAPLPEGYKVMVLELRNAQSLTVEYDGINSMRPTFCYLKPYYNDPNEAYFRQIEDREV